MTGERWTAPDVQGLIDERLDNAEGRIGGDRRLRAASEGRPEDTLDFLLQLLSAPFQDAAESARDAAEACLHADSYRFLHGTTNASDEEIETCLAQAGEYLAPGPLPEAGLTTEGSEYAPVSVGGGLAAALGLGGLILGRTALGLLFGGLVGLLAWKGMDGQMRERRGERARKMVKELPRRYRRSIVTSLQEGVARYSSHVNNFVMKHGAES